MREIPEDGRQLADTHLGDAALHDKEVRVIHIQLHRVKEVLHATAVPSTQLWSA